MSTATERTALLADKNVEEQDTTDVDGSTDDGNEKQSSFVTIFSIWNVMMGTSLVSMPWGYTEAGLATSLVVHVAMVTMTVYTAYIILVCAANMVDPVTKKIPELIDMCRILIGPWTIWLNIIGSSIVFGGALIVYWILMVELLYNSVNSFYYFSDPTTNHTISTLSPHNVTCQLHADLQQTGIPEWWKKLVLPFIFIPLFLPILQLRKITFFSRLGAFGTLSVVILIISVIYKCVTWGFNANFNDTHSIHYIPQFKSSFPSLSGLLAMAFFLHNSLTTIFKHNKYQANNVRDLFAGYTLAFLTYTVIALSIYLAFPGPKSCIKQNFLDNLSYNDEVALAAQLVLFLRMLTVFPIVAYIFRVQLFTLISGVEYPGKFQVAIFNVLLITSCVLCAVFFPNVGDIIRYAGAFCGMMIMFVLPCTVRYIYKRKQGTTNNIETIVLVIVSILGVVNFIGQFTVSD
uniref:Neutral amino acid transporter 9 n=1 Tax=Ciona intestinalis TaxID=7719 RepID=F6UMK9_CIOIN|nr:sodium-coupled neutral amino acid transporter 9-like [Ciona intestinalis]|eukprot:XP_002131166.1 sodium-coupled neutral amino acid transporter 9-like [Ciona intestinalis]